MNEGKENKRTLIILGVISVIIIVGAIIFNKVTDRSRDWDKMRAGDSVEETAQFPFDEGKEQKEGFGAIKVLVLRNKTSNSKECYSYELSVSGDKLLFSCDTYMDGKHYLVENKSINTSRLVEVTDIIDRYTVATTIRNYRKNPDETELNSDEDQALEITWMDGDFANLGYPNGAGDALRRYFESLVNWLVAEKDED